MKTPEQIISELQGKYQLPINLVDAIKVAQDNAYECGRAELSAITHRNYLATVRRGLITPTTCVLEFCDKIDEEKKELLDSYMCDTFDPSELADIALVCFAMAEHYGIDLVDEMRKKTEFNEKRKD